MGNFFDKIRSIKDGLFGKKEVHEDKPSVTPAQEAVREEATPSPQERAPYYIQIGFDFGTSFSKCIFRDIEKNKAWIYCPPYSNNTELPFLIPSTVRYHKGVLEAHDDVDTLYPVNGLPHLKFALEKVAKGDFSAPVLNDYKQALGSTSADTLSNFVECCAVFYLATSFSLIIDEIRNRFQNFGDNSEDQIAINMAIPVADVRDRATYEYYKKILKKSWVIAEDTKTIKSIPVQNVQRMLDEIDISNISDDLCYVYPEVSANMQAFVQSSTASANEQRIYFFSDTGAGTVDQSVFIYLGGEKKQFVYLAANISPLGSSLIDRYACGENTTNEEMEFWRKKKESGSNDLRIQSAKQLVEDAFSREFKSKTLSETKSKLPTGPGVTPLSTLKEHARVIFGGGGHSKTPYESGVLKAFKMLFNDKSEPYVTASPIPTDLELNGNGMAWMNRLYVAYGLSFSSADLDGDQVFPPPPKPPKKKIVKCTCRGNPDCFRCGGWGSYEE